MFKYIVGNLNGLSGTELKVPNIIELKKYKKSNLDQINKNLYNLEICEFFLFIVVVFLCYDLYLQYQIVRYL